MKQKKINAKNVYHKKQVYDMVRGMRTSEEKPIKRGIRLKGCNTKDTVEEFCSDSALEWLVTP